MTTSNDASSGNADTPEKATTSRRGGRAKRTTQDGELVKADNGTVMVLDDGTRLVVTDSLPNHRPISLVSFEIVGTLDRAGVRPIGANTFAISNIDLLPGDRPVAVSDLHIADLHVLPGDRPIAPNDTVDPPVGVLMGYLD